MRQKSIYFLFFGLILCAQSIQAQDTGNFIGSDSTQVTVKKEEKAKKEKLPRKLERAQKKQGKLLQKLQRKDSSKVTSRQLKKLEANAEEIRQLEKELTPPKIDQDKLLTDLSKDENVAPYLKDYAKYKQVKDAKNGRSALKTTNKEVVKSKEIDEALKESDKLKGAKLDSVSLVSKGKTYGLKELNKQEEVKELKKELKPFMDSPYLKGYTLQDLDSLSADSLKVIAKDTFNNLDKQLEKELSKREDIKAFQREMAKTKEFKNLPESYKKQFDQYSDKEYLQTEGVSRAVKEASKYLAEHQKELNEAQKELTKLKKKYSSVPNSNDLSTATKRNSLKGKPFKERMVFGGNFQLVSTEPLIIDISPVLGYRIDKRFTIAIGATYRARLTEYPKNKIPPTGKDDLTYGYRIFTDYTFWKGFYAHGEYERMSKEFEITPQSDRYERKWVEAAMLGMGRTYTINKTLKGGVQLMYNFLHNNTERVYTSPWVFRFGFEFK